MKHKGSIMSVNYQIQSLGNISLMLLGYRPITIDIMGNGSMSEAKEEIG